MSKASSKKGFGFYVLCLAAAAALAAGIYFIVIGNDENNEFFSFPTKIEISGPRDPIYIYGPDCPKQKCFRFYLSERKFLACVEKFYKD